MNFLAHLYLSPDNDYVKLGNFIADAVKGIKMERYNNETKRGILLHRKIDNYTDNHPVFNKSSNRLNSKYRMYSMVIIDIYYDHFLARKWENYSDKDLTNFVFSSYKILVSNYSVLPPRYRRILPYMISQNWLAGYASLWSLKRVFYGMAKRTNFKSGIENAVTDLKLSYNEFEKEFEAFFPDIITFVSKLKY